MSASACPAFRFSKDAQTLGAKLARARRRARTESRKRKACVAAVWERERGRCINPECHRECIHPKDAISPAQENVGHVHEEPPRSLGGDRTDPKACALLCNVCHDRRHRKRQPWITPEQVLSWMHGACIGVTEPKR